MEILQSICKIHAQHYETDSSLVETFCKLRNENISRGSNLFTFLVDLDRLSPFRLVVNINSFVLIRLQWFFVKRSVKILGEENNIGDYGYAVFTRRRNDILKI